MQLLVKERFCWLWGWRSCCRFVRIILSYKFTYTTVWKDQRKKILANQILCLVGSYVFIVPTTQAGNGDYPGGYCTPIPVPATAFPCPSPSPYPSTGIKICPSPYPSGLLFPWENPYMKSTTTSNSISV